MNSRVLLSVPDEGLDAGLDLATLHAQRIDLALHVFQPLLRLLEEQVGAALGLAQHERGLLLCLLLDLVGHASAR